MCGPRLCLVGVELLVVSDYQGARLALVLDQFLTMGPCADVGLRVDYYKARLPSSFFTLADRVLQIL